jgi:hypothetical protein
MGRLILISPFLIAIASMQIAWTGCYPKRRPGSFSQPRCHHWVALRLFTGEGGTGKENQPKLPGMITSWPRHERWPCLSSPKPRMCACRFRPIQGLRAAEALLPPGSSCASPRRSRGGASHRHGPTLSQDPLAAPLKPEKAQQCSTGSYRQKILADILPHRQNSVTNPLQLMALWYCAAACTGSPRPPRPRCRAASGATRRRRDRRTLVGL